MGVPLHCLQRGRGQPEVVRRNQQLQLQHRKVKWRSYWTFHRDGLGRCHLNRSWNRMWKRDLEPVSSVPRKILLRGRQLQIHSQYSWAKPSACPTTHQPMIVLTLSLKKFIQIFTIEGCQQEGHSNTKNIYIMFNNNVRENRRVGHFLERNRPSR